MRHIPYTNVGLGLGIGIAYYILRIVTWETCKDYYLQLYTIVHLTFQMICENADEEISFA